jgi:hypothetical protein
MAEYKGTARTCGELIKILEQFPAEKPVRVLTMSHEWPPDVREHQRCVTLEP